MNQFKIPNFQMFFSGRIPQKDITKITDRLGISPSGNLEAISPEVISIAVIQLLYKRYESLEDYIVDMNLYIGDAVNRRAQIVVFPAYTGLLPLSAAPQSEKAYERLRASSGENPDASAIGECLSVYSDYLYDVFYYTMSSLAAKHQVYVMAGSTLYFEGDELRHRAFLFDHTGSLAGVQDKLGLSTLERELAVEEGNEIKVFDTPMSPLSILIGNDVDYFETAKIARGLGAKVILNPTVRIKEYTPADAAGGLNLRVQENRIYGVQSALVGDSGFGFRMEGPGCIYAPNMLIRAKNGVLEQSSGRFEPDVLCRGLDTARLDAPADVYTRDKNPSFMERYADRLY